MIGEPTLRDMSWAERVAEQSHIVQRSRARGAEQVRSIVEAAERLITTKGSGFTTQELVKEAGVALQTFYRYFGSKDQLLLAVIENMVDESTARFREEAKALPDPVARLRHYVISVVDMLGSPGNLGTARFLAGEHWRLQATYPDAMALASRSYTELVQEEIEAAAEAGLLRPVDSVHGAWLVTQLVRAGHHHGAFVTPGESYRDLGAQVWLFCLGGLGGAIDPNEGSGLNSVSRHGSASVGVGES